MGVATEELGRTPLSTRVPWLRPAARLYHRTRRYARWALSDARWATAHDDAALPARVLRHKSLLLRTLGNSEMWLQHGKVENLRLAAPALDGLLIRPGETFSFNRAVGDPTAARGYVEGMKLAHGEAVPGVGGGICQLANLVHWMVLHSPLTVVERSEHSFDPFPDHGRVLPWGVGCAILYPYVDLVVRNDTERTFQLRVSVGERYLEGDLRADEALPHSYHVYAVDEQFVRSGERVYRSNEIRRELIDRRTGDRVHDESVRRNHALVKYDVDPANIRDA